MSYTPRDRSTTGTRSRRVTGSNVRGDSTSTRIGDSTSQSTSTGRGEGTRRRRQVGAPDYGSSSDRSRTNDLKIVSNVENEETTSRGTTTEGTIPRGTTPRGTTSDDTRGRRVFKQRTTRSTVQRADISSAAADFAKYLPLLDDDTVEVECKFGLGKSTGFTTRVSTSILPGSEDDLLVEQIRDYIWNQSSSRSVRYSGNRVYSKTTEMFKEYSSGQFMAKVTAAHEEDVTGISPEQVVRNATLIREKTRYSKKYRGTVLSVTYVTTTRINVRGGNPNTTEIEVEALPGTTMSQFMAVVIEVAARLDEWMTAMEVYRSAMEPDSTKPAIYTRFRGSMPIAFRPSYSLEDYSVKNKMDGERVNVIAVDGKVYLLTRSDGLMFTDIVVVDDGRYVADAEWIDAYLINDDGTVDLLDTKHIVAFDMMYSPDLQSMLNLPYSDRYDRLREWVQTVQVEGTEIVLSEVMDPVDTVIDRDDTGRTVWIHDGVKYYTDGLILQSYSSPYVTGTDTSQYKWKEDANITVDFRAKMTDSTVELYIAIPGDSSDNREIMATTTTLESMEQQYDGQICEFSYDRQSGNWRFERVRSDKSSPNFITVAFDNMEAALSSLAEEEMLELLHSYDSALFSVQSM